MMTLHQLEHLLALDETRHFARAADKVHLSQPAFSRSIQSLEKQSGLQLFERKVGEIRPTPAGEFLIERARKILLGARALERDLTLYQQGEVGELAFGLGPFPAATLASPVLECIRTQHPEVNIRVEVGSPSSLLPQLLVEDIEFFVADTREIPSSTYLNIRPVMKQSGQLYARPGQPLTRGSHDFKVAWSYGVATVKLPDSLKAQLGKLLNHDASKPLDFALECDDVELLHRVALNSNTVVASTELAVKSCLDKQGLKPLRIKDFPRISAHIAVVSLKHRSLSPVALQAMSLFTR